MSNDQVQVDKLGGACGTYRQKRHTYRVWCTNSQKYHLENLGVDGRIILKRALNKQDARAWIGCIWLGKETSDGVFYI
jgi:hypothetical protein